MNIGIDANCIVFDRSGFGRYAKNLVENILKIDRQNHYFLYASFVRKPQRRQILEEIVFKAQAKNVTIKILPIPAAWKEFLTGFPIDLKYLIKDDLDLFFAPHYAGIPVKGFDNNIVAIQDLVFMRYPMHRGHRLSNYYLKRTKIALKNCEQIIASSISTKKDLIELLDVPKEKIEVVYLGVSSDFKGKPNKKLAEEKVARYIPKKTQYILSVSTLEPRKNLGLLIKAFSLLPHQLRRDYKIVLTGAQGWNNKELLRTIAGYNLTEKVIFTGFVPDEDLPYIYSEASVFVFPSLYEGFGLPPLEAMVCGCPVITSNTSSLPEVVGKAGILIDPTKEEDLARALKKVLTSKTLPAKMIKKGKIQARKFSWVKTAQETVTCFNQYQTRNAPQKNIVKKKTKSS
jgi:glycosyltransferase involved in cell wall biosynthesis